MLHNLVPNVLVIGRPLADVLSTRSGGEDRPLPCQPCWVSSVKPKILLGIDLDRAASGRGDVDDSHLDVVESNVTIRIGKRG